MRCSPAFERNKGPIIEVLRDYTVIPSSASRLLEIASGPCAHTIFFAQEFPNCTFQPSDRPIEEAACAMSLQAYTRNLSRVPDNILEFQAIDVIRLPHWISLTESEGSWDVVMAINLCHISPFACTEGLVLGAGKALRGGGMLFIYGPFKVNGEPTTESNRRFDESLRARDSSWGIRDFEEVVRLAAEADLSLVARVDMPANNFALLFRKPEESS